MVDYKEYILDNGLKIVHMPLLSDVSYCGFIVNVGTRDEGENEYGMAHFVEHMLFKGTQKRRSFHIINRMESVGGDINAYTNKEETVIYSTFLEEHFERAFELLVDLTFYSVFPQKEIDKEIDVVLDEINSYEDSPSELIFDEFENHLFKGADLEHNILGYPESISRFNTEDLKRFVSRYYRPQNMVFFSLGKTDMKKIIRLAEKYLGDIDNEGNPSHSRVSPPEVSPYRIEVDKDTMQSHVIIGGRCYDLHHENKKIFHILNNILGGPGMNSRLNISLREKRGYVYNVESSMTSYQNAGLYNIYFGSDKKNINKCIDLILKEINRVKNTSLTTQQLAIAKKQLIGQIAVSSDNHENLALGFAKGILCYDRFDTLAQTMKKIEAISAKDILFVANEVFRDNNLNFLIYK